MGLDRVAAKTDELSSKNEPKTNLCILNPL
jgi:hypothetical protein